MSIDGQDSSLKADEVWYDSKTLILGARGHVRIVRRGELSTGEVFRFKVFSDDYLVTEAPIGVADPILVLRKASPQIELVCSCFFTK